MKTVFKRISAAVLALAVTVSAVVFDVLGKLSAITAMAVDTHTHTVCAGLTSCTDPNHSGDNHGEEIVWEKGVNKDKIKNGGNYYIDDDKYGAVINLEGGYNSPPITIPSGTNTTLCLNGNTLTINAKVGSPFNIEGSLTICDCKGGGKIYISRKSNVTVFTIEDGGTLNLYNGIIKDDDNGKYNTNKGVYVNEGACFNMYGGSITECETPHSSNFSEGGIVCNKGTFEMHGGSINNNGSLNNDGSVKNSIGHGTVQNSGTFNMYDGASITGNVATDGGGVYMTGGTFTMHGGEISSNTSTYYACTVYVGENCTFIMNGGSITGNTALSSGGGVRVKKNGTFNMNGGQISENDVKNGYGGGVYVDDNGTFNMTGGTISGNKASPGAGVYICESGKADLSGATITGNIALGSGGGIYKAPNSEPVSRGEDCRLKIKDSTITGNSAGRGGGIYTEDSTLISNCVITDNTATGSGGGVRFEKSKDNAGQGIFLSGKVIVENNKCEGSTAYAKNMQIYAYSTATEQEKYNILKPDGSFDFENSKIGVSTNADMDSCRDDSVKVGTAVIADLSGDFIKAFSPDVEGQSLKYDPQEISDTDTLRYLVLYKSHQFSDTYGTNKTNHWKRCNNGCGTYLVPSEPHTFGDWSITKPATCIEEGSQTKTCEICSYEITETITATGQHTWNAGEVTTEPTCTGTGVKTFTCTVCGATKTEDVDPTGHTEAILPAEAATCTTAGKTAGKKCSVCGTILTAQTPTSALGHSWNSGSITKQPTCSAKGVKTFKCTRTGCNGTKTEDVAIVSTAHSWGAWTTTKSATCIQTGNEQRICSLCKKVENKTISKAAHTTTLYNRVEATCTANGNIEYWHCSGCNKNYSDSACTTVVANTSIAALGHNYTSKITKAATCTKKGTKTFTCTRCSDSYTEEVAMIAHTPEAIPNVSATCTTKGQTGGTRCSVCKTQLTAPTVKNALGHNKTATARKEATCTTDGNIAYWHCSRCNKYFTNSACTTTTTLAATVIPKTGHNWSTAWSKDENNHWYKCTKCDAIDGKAAHGYTNSVVESKQPTCADKGQRKHYCVCGAFTLVDDIPALGHDWGNWAVVTAPTKGTAGTAKRVCKRDGSHSETKTLPVLTDSSWTKESKAAKCTEDGYEKYTGYEVTVTVTLPQTGHTVVNDTRVEPTCTTTGLEAGSHCSVCNTILVKQETINALGHDWDEDEVTTAPTCTETGVRTITCKRGCGETQTETEPMAPHTEELFSQSRRLARTPDLRRARSAPFAARSLPRKRQFPRSVMILVFPAEKQNPPVPRAALIRSNAAAVTQQRTGLSAQMGIPKKLSRQSRLLARKPA